MAAGLAPADPRGREALRRLGVLRGDGSGTRLELQSSGSLAAPRTVVRSVESWVSSFPAFTELTGLTDEDVVLVPAPPHSSMFAFATAHAVWLGAETVGLSQWSAREASAAASRCTAAHLTPSMLDVLLAVGAGRLRTVVCAGSALPTTVRTRAKRAGLRVVDYYGATELSFVAARHPDGRMLPFPDAEVQVREGVVWVRSPWVCTGYAAGQSGPLRRDADGWATVGDRGHWDPDGGLVVTGRGDDLILCGGASVLPSEVEHVLQSLPGVATAVVVGLPHPQLGEVVAAVLVPQPGAGLDLAGVRHLAAEQLAPTHLPRRWQVTEQLPLTAAGKVSRQAVRDLLRAPAQQEPVGG